MDGYQIRQILRVGVAVAIALLIYWHSPFFGTEENTASPRWPGDDPNYQMGYLIVASLKYLAVLAAFTWVLISGLDDRSERNSRSKTHHWRKDHNRNSLPYADPVDETVITLVGYLHDFLFQRYDASYYDWRIEKAYLRNRLATDKEEHEQLDRERAKRTRQVAEVDAEKKKLATAKRAAEQDHQFKREKQHLAQEWQKVASEPEQLSRLREFERERESLKSRIRQKERGIGQDLDLGELREKLASSEARVKAERERTSTPNPSSEPPMTSHLSDKQMQEMSRKFFIQTVNKPQAQRASLIADWQEAMENRYGPLVAEELAQTVRQLLAG